MLQRNPRSSPYVIGLTGSIGMGKTTIASLFRRLGAAVCDSDSIVHSLLGEHGKAVQAVASVFPDARAGNSIDRKKLGREVFADRNKLKSLEAILHPLVRHEQQRFIRNMKIKGKKVIILDIPLLFETSAHQRCHMVVVVSAPAFLQRQRVLARPGMTPEKLAGVLARQMPDRQKRKLADCIIDTGLGKAYSMRQVRQIMLKRVGRK